MRAGRPPDEPQPKLTARQLEILELMAKGLTNREICAVLGISANTVKAHVAAILKALDVTNRTEAAVAHRELAGEGAAADEEAAPGAGAPPGGRVRLVGRPAVAVLPFDDLSGARDQEYFADGLVEDLITRLAAWRWVPVIARNSSFTFRGKPVDVQSIGESLGARYLVEGSVRRAGRRVRTTAQLIDAETARHVWAERYELEIEDVFDAQDELARKIVASLEPELLGVEQERAAGGAPRVLDAWDAVLRGLWHARRRTPAELERALACFETALARDPEFAPAWIGRAYTHYQRVFEQWAEDPAGEIAGLEHAAGRALGLDDKDASAHIVSGLAHMVRGRRDDAIAHLESATRLNPSAAEAWGFLGQLRAMGGDLEAGIAHLEEAIRLSPRDPVLWTYQGALALSHFARERDELAIEWAQRSLRSNRDFAIGLGTLAASRAFLGELEAARAAVAELRRVRPDFRRSRLGFVVASTVPGYVDRFFEGLRRAGFEEPPG